MIFVITGNGKGKTTSSVGMVVRALGNNLKCAVFQFIKQNPLNTGEFRILSSLGVDWKNYGMGFVRNEDDIKAVSALCIKGWHDFLSVADRYDFVVLDEFTYVLNMGILKTEEVVSALNNLKAHIVITGRDADRLLMDAADTVSEVVEIKHHFGKVKKSIKGIEY